MSWSEFISNLAGLARKAGNRLEAESLEQMAMLPDPPGPPPEARAVVLSVPGQARSRAGAGGGAVAKPTSTAPESGSAPAEHSASSFSAGDASAYAGGGAGSAGDSAEPSAAASDPGTAVPHGPGTDTLLAGNMTSPQLAPLDEHDIQRFAFRAADSLTQDALIAERAIAQDYTVRPLAEVSQLLAHLLDSAASNKAVPAPAVAASAQAERLAELGRLTPPAELAGPTAVAPAASDISKDTATITKVRAAGREMER